MDENAEKKTCKRKETTTKRIWIKFDRKNQRMMKFEKNKLKMITSKINCN
jgi:hypothetical protein